MLILQEISGLSIEIYNQCLYHDVNIYRQFRKKKKTNNKVSVLEKYGRDLTLLARKEKLDPLIGRNREIERIIQVLTRESCLNIKGNFVKDLSIFNKDLKDIIIIDNNPVSYALHKNNGIPILTWIDNPNDNELLKLIPILKYMSMAIKLQKIKY